MSNLAVLIGRLLARPFKAPRPLPPNLFRAYQNGRLAAKRFRRPPRPYRHWPRPTNIGNRFEEVYNQGLQDGARNRQPRYIRTKPQ